MKKSLLALAVLSAVGGVAQAESSVTLFGVVDLAVQRVKVNDTTATKLTGDGNSSSRIGLRGVEDLAPGLQAGFWLEGALTPDDGTATGQTWKRRSTVSLISASLGELRLGRDYVPTFWNQTQFDPFGTNGVGNHNNVMNVVSDTVSSGGKGNTFVRADNSLGYFLPSLKLAGGTVTGQGMYAMPENALSTNNKYLGARLVYASGPMTLAWSGATVSLVNAATGSNDNSREEKVMNLAGSYKFANNAVLMGQFNRYLINDWTTYTSDNKVQNILLGVTYPASQNLTLKASYNASTTRTVAGSGAKDAAGRYATVATNKKAGATQLALGAVYDLSKRSAVYATFSSINNDDGGKATVGSVSGVTAAAGKGSTGLELGVRHSF